jgi:AcrR family transcriptional regulator
MTMATAGEKDPVRKKILAAMDRLLAGTPLRSTGHLSVSQLAAEAGIARWHLTHQHTDLKEMFQARVKSAAADAARSIRQLSETEQLKAKNAQLADHCAELEEQLARYAAVISLLMLEKAAADGTAPVTALKARRQRHAAIAAGETEEDRDF